MDQEGLGDEEVSFSEILVSFFSESILLAYIYKYLDIDTGGFVKHKHTQKLRM